MLDKLKKIERGTLALIAVATAVLFFIAVNILASGTLKSSQLDLTEDSLYTLSPGTVSVLKSIDEPITLKFYLSRALTEQSPVHAQYANRVRELLERYAHISGGKVKLETYAPEPYTLEDDRAMQQGLQGVPVDSAGAVGYFGLVAVNSTDDALVIPFFDPGREQYLEYDLTKLIHSLANPKKPTIGLLSYLPLAADPAHDYKPWEFYRELTQFFTVKSLRTMGRVPDDIDVLLIVHPKNLTTAEQFAVDQFVLRGGKALVIVDPHFETTKRDISQGPPAVGETGSNLPKLFDAWGVEFSTGKVVGDRTVAQSVTTSQAGGRTQVADYLPWLALRAPNFAKDDVTTAQMSRINMASAGFFTLKPGAKTELKPLLFSSPQAEQIDVSDVNFIPDPAALLNDFKSENRVFTLAARLTGPVKSIYPDGPPWDPIKKPGESGAGTTESGKAVESADDGAKPKQKYLTESVKPINVVLVGDADMLAEKFWLQTRSLYGGQGTVPIANNAEFLINVLDNLSGSDDLIGLRSRGLSYRPFVVTEDIRRDAEMKYRETEQKLALKLQNTEAKLQELRTKGDSSGEVLSNEQRQEIENFRHEVIVVRQQLRDVQHALRKDIDALDTSLKIINIWAMPVIIAILALVLFVIRQARRRRHVLHT